MKRKILSGALAMCLALQMTSVGVWAQGDEISPNDFFDKSLKQKKGRISNYLYK